MYMYREGVLRTSSERYDDDYSNITAHLTNHHLQEQFSPNYGKYENGNEMFFDEFNRYALQLFHIVLTTVVLNL